MGGLLLSGEPGIGEAGAVRKAGGSRQAGDAGWTVPAAPAAGQAEAGIGVTRGCRTLPAGVFDEAIAADSCPAAATGAGGGAAPGRAWARAPPGPGRCAGSGVARRPAGSCSDGPRCSSRLDDVQWLDAASAGVVGMAVRRVAERERVAVVATRRTQPAEPADRGPVVRRPARSRSRCLPLGPASMHRLVRAALGQGRAAVDARGDGARVQAGDPFFAVELARSAALTGAMRIPDSLRDLLGGRLEPPAGGDVRDVLLDASALARPTVEVLAPQSAVAWTRSTSRWMAGVSRRGRIQGRVRTPPAGLADAPSVSPPGKRPTLPRAAHLPTWSPSDPRGACPTPGTRCRRASRRGGWRESWRTPGAGGRRAAQRPPRPRS